MPLQPAIYPSQLVEKLKVSVTELLREGFIPLVSSNPVSLKIAFMLDIQQLRIEKRIHLKSTDPEGIRVVLANDNGVEAALDFYVKNEEVNFTHSIAGAHLQEFIASLNALEQLYKKRKADYYAACVDFHYATHPYLVAFNTRSAHWYNYYKGSLLRLKPADFKKQLGYLTKRTPKSNN
jgi:hypothetical protein